MSENLATVGDYISDVRVLLLDTLPPYRYPQTELVVAFNSTLQEARRLRADIFMRKNKFDVPVYTDQSMTEEVPIEPQFRLAFVYGSAAHCFDRDDEDVQDERASTFRNFFYGILTGVVPPPIRGGTPAPSSPQG